jgi:hypothetical protein
MPTTIVSGTKKPLLSWAERFMVLLGKANIYYYCYSSRE